MVARLARFKLAGLFLELAAKYRIGNCLGNVELIEAGMRILRDAGRESRSRRGRFKLVEAVIYLFDGCVKPRQVILTFLYRSAVHSFSRDEFEIEVVSLISSIQSSFIDSYSFWSRYPPSIKINNQNSV